MPDSQFVSVILSGGSGTRLWPKSRKNYPKQFLQLTGTRSMLQETALRVGEKQRTLVVTNEDHRFLVAHQLSEVCEKPPEIILEPVARNTAPAIALAAIHAMADGEDPILVVLPSDHLIRDSAAFRSSLQTACQAAASGALVTFGIKPDKPETGYGYIRAERVHGDEAVPVAAFVEKPDADTARSYLESGQYFWNSGMFVFKASVFLQALDTHAPEILKHCRAASASFDRDGDFLRPEEESFGACPSDSIDYAVMENAENAMMVPLQSDWNDIGSWSSLWSVLEKDGRGNVIQGEVLSRDCDNSLFDSSGRLIAALGLSDIVVVDAVNAVLVADKSRVQQVKDLVSVLEKEGKTEFLEHTRVHRPWGTYESIHNGSNHQVKHITVKPGASLSLQLHHHRSEHWVVVGGTALVEVGEMKKELNANESVYIPVETTHRLSNKGTETLHLIEVQCGDYLGEDDIVRFDDIYGRTDSPRS